MLAKQIQVGGVCAAKISGRIVDTRVDAIREYDPSFGGNSLGQTRSQTRYDVTNLVTGRKTTFRSASKFRWPARGVAVNQ